MKLSMRYIMSNSEKWCSDSNQKLNKNKQSKAQQRKRKLFCKHYKPNTQQEF
jgi:hypothetical protein